MGDCPDGFSCAFVHIVPVGLARVHYASCLAASVKRIFGPVGMDAARDEDGGLDLRLFQSDGLVEPVNGVLGSTVCRPYRKTEYS